MEAFTQLETTRLVLRKLDHSDWESIAYLRSDKIVNQFVKRKSAETKEKAIAFIESTNSKTDNKKIFYWCINLKGAQKMMGSICLWNFSEDEKTAEIGYDLDPKYQNKGIMNESMGAVLKFGFETLNLNKIEAFTQIQNKNSIRLLTKNSFRLNKQRSDPDNRENIIFTLKRPTTEGKSFG